MSTSSKILTEASWKAASRDAKVRDKDLRRALVDYQSALKSDDPNQQLEAIAKVSSCATDLKRDRDVASQPELVSHLARLLGAAQAAERDHAKSRKSSSKVDEEEEDDEDGPSYGEKLAKVLEKLKSASKPYHFVVCVATPYCTISIGKNRVTGKRLKEISEAAGGSRRFLKPGTCSRQGSRLIFEMEEDAPKGLALKIKRSIKHFTGKKYAVSFGNDTAEEDEEDPLLGGEGGELEVGEVTAGGIDKPGAGSTLGKTPELWTSTRRAVKAKVDQLKASIRSTYAAEGEDLIAALEQTMKTLDRVFERLDTRLAAALERAASATGADRETAIKSAKALLAEQVQYVKTEPMIAHIDANPFGIVTNLQATLTKSLRHVVQALGDGSGR